MDHEAQPLGELYAALAAVQAELSTVTKDGSNPHFRSAYTTLAGLRRAVNPVLAKHGLCCYHLLGRESVVTVLGHKSGVTISSETPILTAKADSQGYGSAATYACRYALHAILGVAPGDDDDGNDACGHERQAPEPMQRRQEVRTAPQAVKRASDSALARMHALGVQVYGKTEWDAKRHALVHHVTGGKSTSSNDLSAEQLATLIDGLEKKHNEQHEANAAAHAYPAGSKGN